MKIELENIEVNGINTLERASTIKNILVRKKSPSGSKINILNNINFTAKSGDRVGVIGKNGSGKSSLLKVISGHYPPSSGRLEVKGSVVPLIEMGAGFDQEATGRDNIFLTYIYRGKLREYNKEMEEKIIEFSELGEKIDVPLKTYSSGMVQRLAFSSAVFQSPEILLLDEIFSAGDFDFVEKSKKMMMKKWEESEIAIITSHSDDDLRSLCNRAVLIENGTIIKEGGVEEILSVYHGEQN
ncbi:MAG: ABC transporter ATP-binding protein [Legionellales bacterium]|nr:ABC transporter ATP-binding protein [Legionellales bacterium]